MLEALDVAKYLLSLVDIEKGQVISNLALQKLLYYCQGYYLALEGKRLFKENIEAWKHGPVVDIVYQYYKDKKDNPLSEKKLDFEEDKKFSKEQKKLIKFIFDKYSIYSAYGLREMTHKESPWKNSYIDGRQHTIIEDKNLLSFFTPIVEKINELIFLENTKQALKELENIDITNLSEYKFGI